jgi:diguanylate cyclase (GGDEF)-like protein
MKIEASVLAILLGLAANAYPSTPAPLTTLRAVHALSNAQAEDALPVSFEATVTYFKSDEGSLFVEDGGQAIYVLATTGATLIPGDRVLINGTTQPSFRPIVRSGDIRLLQHGPPPRPTHATFGQMIQANLDCMYVTVRGLVRFAEAGRDDRAAQLELAIDGGEVGVTIDTDIPPGLPVLVDSEVEVTGVVSGQFDSKMQLVGILLRSASFQDIRIVRPAPSGARDLPIVPMDHVLSAYDVDVRSRRVRVEGTITYFHPAWMAVLQNGDKSIRVLTKEVDPLAIGAHAEATGIPAVDDGLQTLELGEIKTTGPAAPIAPLAVTWDDLASGKNAFNLVSIEGKVVSQVREEERDIYVISAGGRLLSAALRHPYVYDLKAKENLPPMREVRAGSTVRVTGVATYDDASRYNGGLTFGVLLRTANDVEVIANPSWLNVDNLVLVIGLLLAAVIAFGGWSWSLDRKVRRQATALARSIETEANLERRRSRILEDINGSRPLTEIIEQIAALVSCKLGGAPCWCQMSDGARLGDCPPQTNPERLVRHEVNSRAEQVLATLCACVAQEGLPTREQLEALAMGAGLVELAIENRRLYSDLRHRSEFDQLTDIHNRFSLEKNLDTLIAEARNRARIFGLVYIDLDGFKEVNDRYGHQAGDIYLREAAQRMKSQLRGSDMLARLGGDEFAALLPMVQSRAGAEEVAQRLERCFEAAFDVEGVELRGTASMGVAMYPEDGATRDSLLSAADAAMYVAKHARTGRAADGDGMELQHR